MSTYSFAIPVTLDVLAVFAWALSGAIVGMRHGFDITGVFVVSLLSSVGGSLIRDAFFLQQPPPVLVNPYYLPIILLATLLAAAAGRRLAGGRYSTHLDRVILATDAFGAPAFAVLGMQLALLAGIPLPGVVLVGVANGVGGGMLRDLVVGEVPSLLMPGQHFATALTLVCVIFLVVTETRLIGYGAAGLLTIALFVLIRFITIRYNLRTKPLLGDPAA